jgi:dTDP-4-amino-4,6-dideoxygalactose transaminase
MHEDYAAVIAGRLRRRYGRLVGRGTTALFIALRAIAEREGSGEIILPDMICSAVLDGVVLAGFSPVFADILPNRFTLDYTDVRRKIRPATRAVIAAHVFGHVEPIPPLPVPVIEDAVQGLGAAGVGQMGEISFISFDDTKMIGGRGGVVLTDDRDLAERIDSIALTVPPALLSDRLQSYRDHLDTPALLRSFDADHIDRIERDWQTLSEQVHARNQVANYLHERLADLPLHLPILSANDAVWRFSFAAPTRAATSWIMRHLQRAGLIGSSLYPPLSAIFAPDPALFSASLTHRMVNLWVDSSIDQAACDRAIAIIRALPF